MSQKWGENEWGMPGKCEELVNIDRFGIAETDFVVRFWCHSPCGSVD